MKRQSPFAPNPMIAVENFDPLGRFTEDTMPEIVGAAISYPAGTRLGEHSHEFGQLIFAISGSMNVRADDGLYVVPPMRALWVAPNVPHSLALANSVEMRTLYFRYDALPIVDRNCAVIQVLPLLKELIVTRIREEGAGADSADRIKAIEQLIQSEICLARLEPLMLSIPRDVRVRPIVDAVLSEPSCSTTLQEWSRTVGASLRTIERIFLKQTGMTFRQWRQQARLLKSIPEIAAGAPITQVALDVGYSNPSAFSFMFRSVLGTTPNRYFAQSTGNAVNEE